METKIVLAGGTGFLGQCLQDYYSQRGWTVYVLSRTPRTDNNSISFIQWDGKTIGNWVNCLEGADAVVNLTGKSVDCRYTEPNKQLIYSSRLDATHILGKAIQQCTNPPKVWINAASATIYRHAVDRPMDEESGELGSGFSVDVCQKWERAFHDAQVSKTRKVLLRIAIVLGRNGGALQPLLRLV